MSTFRPNQPIYVGFSGKAGTGKTSTANKIVPSTSVSSYGEVETNSAIWGGMGDDAFPSLVWDHFYLARPLYDLYEARTNIMGEDAQDRILYAIHDVVHSLMMKNIPYDDLIELVYDIFHFPLGPGEGKPRSFLQQVGDLCRSKYDLCMSNHMKYKVYNAWQNLSSEYHSHEEDPPWYVAIVSDVRRIDEAEMLRTRPNNFMVKFTASPEELRDRLYSRDGTFMTTEQMSHVSEMESEQIPDDWFDLILDTTGMTLTEQASAVYDAITHDNTFEVL